MYLNVSQNIVNLNVSSNTLLTLSLTFITVTTEISSTFGGYSMVAKGTICTIHSFMHSEPWII